MAYSTMIGALAEPMRRQIFERLAHRPASVGELTARLPISQPAVSQHLAVLRDAGLVTVRRDGQRRIYSVSPGGIAELRTYFDSLWGDVLTAFAKGPAKKAKGSSK